MKRILQEAVDGLIDGEGVSNWTKEQLLKLYDELRKANSGEVGRYIMEKLNEQAEERLRDIADGY